MVLVVSVFVLETKGSRQNIGKLGHLPSFFGMNMKQVMYSKPPPPVDGSEILQYLGWC